MGLLVLPDEFIILEMILLISLLSDVLTRDNSSAVIVFWVIVLGDGNTTVSAVMGDHILWAVILFDLSPNPGQGNSPCWEGREEVSDSPSDGNDGGCDDFFEVAVLDDVSSGISLVEAVVTAPNERMSFFGGK